MIVRILKGHVDPVQVTVFREHAGQALEDARRSEGLIYAEVARQACADGGEEVIFVSAWRDLEALYQWIGGMDLLDTPMLNACTPGILERFGVEHYEAYDPADSDPLEPGVTGPAAVSSDRN